MAYEYDEDELKKKLRPNLPGGISTPLTVDTSAPGGIAQAGERMLYAPPTGPTQTNFPTSRDIVPGQPAPVAPLAAQPVAPTPVPVQPAQPTITALTTNAQMEEITRKAAGLGTGLDRNALYGLGIRAGQGDKEAQDILQKAGVTAPSGVLTNTPEAMTYMKAQMATRGSLPPRERKVAEADYNRALAIYTQQREQAYADDTRKMAYDTMQSKLGNERLKTAEIQGQIALHAENILDKQLERQYKAAKEPYELGAAKTKAELDAIMLQNTQSIQQELISPDTVKADELMAAPTIDKYKQTWDQGLSLAARYNISEPVRNELHLGVLASSYDSPVELAKDSGAEINEDITSVSQSDVAKYAPDIATAISNNVPPDQAVEQILRDSGKEPSDKEYPQLALNISAGVWKQYRDAGEAAMAEAKAAKIYSDTQNRQKAVTQIAQQIPQLSTAGGWNDIVASTQKRLDRLALVRGMKSGIVGEQQGVLAEARIRGEFGLGASEQYTKSTSEQIKGMIINHMAETAGNDPSYKAWLANQATNPDSEVSRLLTMGVNEARKGQKSEMEEQEKKQTERKVKEKEAQDYAKENAFVVEFDPLTHDPVFFANAEGAKAYRNEPSELGKANLAKAANDLTKERLADPGYQLFIGLSDEEKNNIRQKINLAKMLWNQNKAGMKPSDDALATLADEELNITNVEQIPAAINAYSNMYGQGDVFAEVKAAGGPWWNPSAAEWEVITGQKPEAALAEEGQPVTRTDTTGRVWTLKDGKWE